MSDRGIRCYVRREAVKSADDILSVIKSSAGAAAGEGRSRTTPLRAQAARLMLLLHKYARENLLVANIYIKDSADASILNLRIALAFIMNRFIHAQAS